jgi:hypothetical protein
MVIEFWDIGKKASEWIPLNLSQISAYVLADWLPGVPTALSTSAVGWPPFVVRTLPFRGQLVLALDDDIRGTERQWKSVLSWMLGVAGSRHVLTREGYRWIAPLSAFYKAGKTSVKVAERPDSYPTTRFTARKKTDSSARHRPDYVAIRASSTNGHEWALAEAKGTSDSLTSLSTCPQAWAKQVRSVDLLAEENVIPVARHIVVATRVNPNALTPEPRRIVVRAWNSTTPPPLTHSPMVAAEIVTAQIYGLFLNLGLPASARALAAAAADRVHRHPDSPPKRPADVVRLALMELDKLEVANPTHENGAGLAMRLETPHQTTTVTLSEALLDLARALMRADDVVVAEQVVRASEVPLDRWFGSQKSDVSGVLPCGVSVIVRVRERG